MTYSVAVTNLGPSAASNVMLTNTLPPGVIPISPTNPAASNIVFTFNLGTLTNGGYTNLLFTVEPTNAGVLTFTASVGSPGVRTPISPTTSPAPTSPSLNYLSGPLAVITNSGQIYNAQNGLVEQSITVTNNDTNTAASGAWS